MPLTTVDVGSLALVLVITVVASAVRGLTGFGLSIVLVPLLNLVIEPTRSVLLAILIGCLVGFFGLKSAWKNVEKPTALTISLSTIAAAPFGLWLLFGLSPEAARLAITGIAVLSVVVLAMPRKDTSPAGLVPAVMVGGFCGFLGAFAAMAGPPAVWYYARKNNSPETIRDAMIVIFFAGPFAVAAMAFASGRLDFELIVLALATLPALALGNLIGRKLFGLLPEAAWRGSVLLLVIFSTGMSILVS